MALSSWESNALSRFPPWLAKRRTQAARFCDSEPVYRRTGTASIPSLATRCGPVGFGDPLCDEIWQGVLGACKVADVPAKLGGTYVCMEGPQFSTKAESNIYRSWGADVIGMTNLQEAKLAREAEICYVTSPW